MSRKYVWRYGRIANFAGSGQWTAQASVKVCRKYFKMNWKGKKIKDFKELGAMISDTVPETEVKGGRPSDATMPDKRRKARECTDAGHGQALSKGMRVRMMDSRQDGTIISAGRKVTIGLDDGMVIEVEYGTFVLADIEEDRLLGASAARADGKKDKMETQVAGTGKHGNRNYLEIDLHMESLPEGKHIPQSHKLEYQMEIFRKTVRENLRHRGMKIKFIHGVGDGILRNCIEREMEEVFAGRCSWTSSPAVTVVTVR